MATPSVRLQRLLVCIVLLEGVASCNAVLGIPGEGNSDPNPAAADASDSSRDAASVDGSGDDPEALALLEVTPRIATAGATLVLEGTFATDIVVNFPGGTVQSAEYIGPHRARVTMPASATEGPLSVTSGGRTFGALVVRRASFELGLQNFQQFYTQHSGGRQAPNLKAPAAHVAYATSRDTLYVIGGGNDTDLDTVQAARTNADGTLRPFTIVARTHYPRSAPAAQVIGRWLYVLGGETPIERAEIADDGTLGPFVVTSRSLAVARSSFSTHVIGARLYVTGGHGSDGDVATVESAVVHPDGSLGAFTVDDAALVHARASHASIVLGDWLYVVGGRSSATVERSHIDGAGRLGPFAIVPAVTLSRIGLRIVRLGNRVYAVGGSEASGRTSSVAVATVGDDGSLGEFNSAIGITHVSRRDGPAAAIIGNFLYLVGGSGDGGRFQTTTEHAAIGAPASLSSFATIPDVSLVEPRWSYASFAVGRYLYVLGGFGSTSLASVERARVAADGSLSSFTVVAPLARIRGGAASAVIGDSLYLFSGYNGSNILTSVERAKIMADGSLGPFEIVPELVVHGRFQGRAVVLGNYVYLLSGDLGGASTPIERATIASDGSLGEFSTVPGVNLATYVKSPSVAVVRGAIITAGGARGSYSNAVQRATYSDDGTLSTFVMSGSLPTTIASSATAVIGGAMYVIGGGNAGGNSSAIFRATISAEGEAGVFATVGDAALEQPRSCEIGCGILIGNHYLLVGGGTNTATLSTATVATVQ